MLIIATDLKETRWLQYIWEEFSRINRAEFAFRILPLDQVAPGTPALYYSREYCAGVCIPNRSQTPPNAQVRWFSSDIFLVDRNLVSDTRFACGYDLFWNAFVLLSRLEEHLEEARGRRINSYARNHPRLDKTTFAIPVVNHLFDALEALIRKNFPALPFGAGQKPVIELSHDLDYIAKTIQLRLKQTAFNCFNIFKALHYKRRDVAELVRKSLCFLLANPSYWCFNYWEELEKRYDRRSVFYVYVREGERDWKTWLLDPSYNLAHNPKLQQRLKKLLEDGFEVGLHGSWHSAVNEARLAAEKALLEKILQREVTKIRQHWLRYAESITPRLHNIYFQFDSTLGWNDRLGFRSGCASRYRPYDHGNQQAFNYLVTPLIIMDSNIFDYGATEVEAISRQAFLLLAQLHNYKTGHVSISWHQRVCSADYGWHGVYEQILRRIS